MTGCSFYSGEPYSSFLAVLTEELLRFGIIHIVKVSFLTTVAIEGTLMLAFYFLMANLPAFLQGLISGACRVITTHSSSPYGLGHLVFDRFVGVRIAI